MWYLVCLDFFREDVYEIFFGYISYNICWAGLEIWVLVCSSVWEVVDNTYGDNTNTICDNTSILVQWQLHKGRSLISCKPSDLGWGMANIRGSKDYYTTMTMGALAKDMHLSIEYRSGKMHTQE